MNNGEKAVKVLEVVNGLNEKMPEEKFIVFNYDFNVSMISIYGFENSKCYGKINSLFHEYVILDLECTELENELKLEEFVEKVKEIAQKHFV